MRWGRREFLKPPHFCPYLEKAFTRYCQVSSNKDLSSVSSSIENIMIYESHYITTQVNMLYAAKYIS